MAAVAVLVATIAMNVGTTWVLFGTDFLSRFADVDLAAGDTLVILAAIAGFAAVSTSYVLVGLLLSGRRSAGRIAAVLLAGGALLAATPFGYAVGGLLVFAYPASPLANALLLVGPVAFGPAFSLILSGLALVFPTGSLPSRRWRLPVALVTGAIGGGTALELLRPGLITGAEGSHNPFGIDGIPAGLLDAALPMISVGIVGTMVFGLAAVLTRYRFGDVTSRQQLRWFVAAVLLAAVPLALSAISGSGGPLWAALACVGLLLVPVSVGIAVTRHRLYEIDRLLSRTIGWGLVTGLLVAVFAAMVLALQALLADFTQGQTLAVAASTLVAYALFQPVRRRVQSAVDRRFDRARYDGERTIAAFTGRLRDQIDLTGLQVDLATTVGQALHPTSTGVWVRLAKHEAG
ncbi:MAG: hypothetical protein ABIR64_10180 [Candidatus Limnocylindrales bacterium]